MKKIISLLTFLALLAPSSFAFAQYTASQLDMSTMFDYAASANDTAAMNQVQSQFQIPTANLQGQTPTPTVKQVVLKPTSITVGAVGPEVATYQEYLKELGFYKGVIDGKFGIGMKTAVAGFQASYGLNADAILGIGTKDRIAKILAQKKADNAFGTGQLPGGANPMPAPTPDRNHQTACLQGSTTPSIKVISPNGGETYQAGDKVTIKWSSCNITGNVDVSLTLPYSNSGFYAWVLGNHPNSGQVTVTLPTTSQWGNMSYGKKFKVSVGATQMQGAQGNMNIFDTSDSLFTINGAQQGACDSEDVEISIASNTPEGEQAIVNDKMNVLKFNIENNSGCDMTIDDISMQTLSTDGVRYFGKASVYAGGQMLAGPLSIQNIPTGKSFFIQMDEYAIGDGDTETFTVVFSDYQQPPFTNLIPYGDYRWKHLLVGVTNNLDAQFSNGEDYNIHGAGVPYFGKVIRISPNNLQ